METLKDSYFEYNEQKELLDALNDVATNIIAVPSKKNERDEEYFFSRMASIDEKDEHSPYISWLNYISSFHILQRDVLGGNLCDSDGIMINTWDAWVTSGEKARFFAQCKAISRKLAILRHSRCSVSFWYRYDSIIRSRQHFLPGGKSVDFFLIFASWMPTRQYYFHLIIWIDLECIRKTLLALWSIFSLEKNQKLLILTVTRTYSEPQRLLCI